MYREIALKNNVIVLPVPFVHHTELQNFLIAPRNVVNLRMIENCNCVWNYTPVEITGLQITLGQEFS